MINLLPPKEKQTLLKERQFREVLILGIIISFFFSLLSLVLFCIKSDLDNKFVLQQEVFTQRNKKLEISKAKDLENKVVALNQTLSNLISFYQNRFYLTPFLEEFSQTIPPGVYLTSISYHQEENKVDISGFSPNRDILFEFKENLEAKESFKDIYFPPSNWISPTDIDFSASFEIK